LLPAIRDVSWTEISLRDVPQFANLGDKTRMWRLPVNETTLQIGSGLTNGGVVGAEITTMERFQADGSVAACALTGFTTRTTVMVTGTENIEVSPIVFSVPSGETLNGVVDATYALKHERSVAFRYWGAGKWSADVIGVEPEPQMRVIDSDGEVWLLKDARYGTGRELWMCAAVKSDRPRSI